MSLDWDLSDVFLLIRLELWVWGRRSQMLSAIFITSYQRSILLTWSVPVDIVLDCLAEALFARRLPVSLLAWPLLRISSRRPHCVQPPPTQ